MQLRHYELGSGVNANLGELEWFRWLESGAWIRGYVPGNKGLRAASLGAQTSHAEWGFDY